ncbi:MAG TPA: GNAT family N-acetyltransferase [Sphingomicrobium sp.]|nr:GNAT family N-acetyltransferase [Sphingomicrobium sp.]
MASTVQPLNITVDRGTADDLDSIMEVMRSAFGDRYGEAWTRSQCAGILPMAGIALTIARDGLCHQVVGFSLTRIIAGESELLLLAVAPEYQRRSVGSVLLDDFIQRSLAAGSRRMHLEVRDGNPAIAMYEASGFSPAGRRKAYYRGGDGRRHDALTYARDAELSHPSIRVAPKSQQD